MALQNLRSGVANKRPIPTIMSEGQIALNTNEASPGLFFKDSNGDLVKVGPVHIGTSAPNSSPASTAATALVTGATYQILTVGTSDFTSVGASANTVGTIFTATGTTTGTGTVSGQQGVEKGEQWLDTTGGNYVLKIYDGTAWRSEAGEFVNVSGDTMTGALLLDNAASASAPDLSFDGDANTGVYSPGADQFGVATGGTAALTIDSSQRVGIGTTSPDSELHIEGTNPFIKIQSDSITGNGGINFSDGANKGQILYDHNGDYMRFSTNGSSSERVRIDSSGNVGIGTTSPNNYANYSTLTINGTSGGILDLEANGTIYGELQALTNEFRINAVGSSGVLKMYAGASERMRIDSSGRVGIGETSMDALLVIKGASDAATTPSIRLKDGSDTREAWISNASGDLVLVNGGNDNVPHCKLHLLDANIMRFDTVNTERMRIDSSGRVGIGESNPSAKLDVYLGDNVAGTIARFGGYNDGRSLVISNSGIGNLIDINHQGGSGEISVSTGSTERMRIDSSGNVGIGTTSLTHKFTVKDAAYEILHLIRDHSSYYPGIRMENSSGRGGVIDAIGDADGGGFRFFGLTGGVLTERVRIDSSGRLLVGTSSAPTTGGQAPYARIGVFGNTFDSSAAGYLNVGRNQAASIMSSGDGVGSIIFPDSAGGQFAQIGCFVDGTPGTNDYPGRLVFSVTQDGASSPTERFRIYSDGNARFSNLTDVYPQTDNAVRLGASGLRWSQVWAANGTIQTSDKRTKTEITNANLGSDFIKSLRPVSYKWIEGGKRDTGERDEDGNYIYESVPGKRTHWGFIAQEVKQAVDAEGVDFGGWVLTDKDDPDSQQALRYDQFIAPLTKALQEALEKIETLEQRLSDAGIA